MGTKTNKQIFWDGFLSLLTNQEEDVRLMACDSNEETALLAHKLSGRSEVFKKMFEADIGKASTKLETITFSELKHEELKAFVDFIYYGDGSVDYYVMSLYRAANKYEIPHLLDLCKATLLASMNSSNALKVLALAEIPFDKALTDAAFNVIITNQRTICNSTEFEAFIINHPNLTLQIMKAISIY